jgi:hypothetical protein
VPVTHVPHENGLFLHAVAALAIAFTGVDGVLEVETFADGVALDDFVAHFELCKVGEQKVYREVCDGVMVIKKAKSEPARTSESN